MKKKMIALLAGAMMTLAASSAFAAFGDGELLRVVYDRNSSFEMITDLGSVTSLQNAVNKTVGGGAAAITNFIPTSSSADLYVAYYAVHKVSTQTGNLWFAADQSIVTDTGSNAQDNGLKWSAVGNGLMPSVATYYQGQTAVSNGTEVSAVGVKTDIGSYVNKLDGSGSSLGSFGGYAKATTMPYTEVSLANLASGGVDKMNLYYFSSANTGQTGVQYLTLTTNAKGETIINAQSTPIPAAIYLMGSGLLGMVGLRRKNRG